MYIGSKQVIQNIPYHATLSHCHKQEWGILAVKPAIKSCCDTFMSQTSGPH